MKPKPTSRPPTPRRVPRRLPPRRTLLQARAAASTEEIEDYDGESEPNMKLSHAFIVVLALHVLAVGGVFAFNSLKARPAMAERAPKAATTTAAQPEPKVETSSPEQDPTAATPAAKVAEKPVIPAKPAPVADAVAYTVVPGDTLTKIAAQHKTSIEAIERANEIPAGSTIHVGQALRIPSADVPKETTSEVKPALTAPKTAATPAAKPVAPKVADAKKVPDAAPTAIPATKPAAAPAAKSAGTTYTVAKGDNPYSIAKKLKVTYAELMKANKIEDPTKLQIGQKLIVP